MQHVKASMQTKWCTNATL